ncbi:MAG TPA: type I-U CRISPR-associated protein Cas8c [Micropepsaceae bacterium]|nr:type I-U CRISPR-associated protein Cas8c [Micropepsaceae bacterium]
MADAKIPVDLLNPGQVFACLGFIEAADILLGDATGGFDWSDNSNVRFALHATGERNPFEAVLQFLVDAEVQWISPSADIRERDGGKTIVMRGISNASEPKASDLPALLSLTLDGACYAVPFGYWADDSSRFSTTFKKSTNGASSHIRFENARTAVQTLLIQDKIALRDDPFGQRALTESLFRLDPRGYVDPINSGSSPDKLRKGGIEVRVATYPVCEALAVIGLKYARPFRIGATQFRYCTWRNLLPPPLARAALGTRLSFTETRLFIVHHDEVKKGGDRRMISIEEETGT